MLALAQCGRQTESKREWHLLDAPHASAWQPAGMEDEGKSLVKEGEMTLGIGGPMTGMTFNAWEQLGVPKESYVIEYEAMRTEGADFFGSVTFPVKGSALTFVLGGWGGTTTGISCIDGLDASDNATRGNLNVVNGRWYRVRIELQEENLRVSIDGRPFVDTNLKGREIGLRHGGIEKCLPFGFASYLGACRVRGISVREW